MTRFRPNVFHFYNYKLSGMTNVSIKFRVKKRSHSKGYYVYIYIPRYSFQLGKIMRYVECPTKRRVIKLINEVCFDHFEY